MTNNCKLKRNRETAKIRNCFAALFRLYHARNTTSRKTLATPFQDTVNSSTDVSRVFAVTQLESKCPTECAFPLRARSTSSTSVFSRFDGSRIEESSGTTGSTVEWRRARFNSSSLGKGTFGPEKWPGEIGSRLFRDNFCYICPPWFPSRMRSTQGRGRNKYLLSMSRRASSRTLPRRVLSASFVQRRCAKWSTKSN